MRSLMIEMVFATDLSRHSQFITQLRTLASTRGHAAHLRASEADKGSGKEWSSPLLDTTEVDVKFLLSVVIKWADLGHCAKPTLLHDAWSARVQDEFFTLGDHENRIGIQVSPLCDREEEGFTLPKSQIGFLRFVCIPLYAVLADLVDPKMAPWLQLNENLRVWRSKRSKEEEVLKTPPLRILNINRRASEEGDSAPEGGIHGQLGILGANRHPKEKDTGRKMRTVSAEIPLLPHDL